MTQPQDPNNRQQPTQPYGYAQPSYGQPTQPQPPPPYPYNPYNQVPPQQQHGQYPQVGYFGGAPEPKKKGLPWWGWLLAVVGVFIVIGVIASIASNSAKNTVTTNATATAGPLAVAATTAPVAAQNNAVTTQAQAATAQRPTQTVRPATAAPTVKEIGVRVAGSGQELIGQNGIQDGLKVTITGVDRFSQLTGNSGKVVQSQGVFLVLTYELDNQSSKPQYLAYLELKDGNGRTFSSSSNMDAIGAIALSGNYKSDLGVQPSFKGKGYSVFEVPADASNLKLKVGF